MIHALIDMEHALNGSPLGMTVSNVSTSVCYKRRQARRKLQDPVNTIHSLENTYLLPQHDNLLEACLLFPRFRRNSVSPTHVHMAMSIPGSATRFGQAKLHPQPICFGFDHFLHLG